MVRDWLREVVSLDVYLEKVPSLVIPDPWVVLLGRVKKRKLRQGKSLITTTRPFSSICPIQFFSSFAFSSAGNMVSYCP